MSTTMYLDSSKGRRGSSCVFVSGILLILLLEEFEMQEAVVLRGNFFTVVCHPSADLGLCLYWKKLRALSLRGMTWKAYI